MDALAIFTVILTLLCLAIGLKEYYTFRVAKMEKVSHVRELIGATEQKESKGKLSERVMARIALYADDFSGIGQRVNFFSEPHDIEQLLRRAGLSKKMTVEKLQGLKMFFFFFGLFTGFILLLIGFPFAIYSIVFLPLAGYLGTILWLKNVAKTRQEQLRYDLPDFLDTVSVTLQTGGGLDQTLKEVVTYFDGPLQEEFARFNQEIELGVPREQAYRELLNRNDNPEFQSLIKSLMQGMKLGVPVATTFKHQAEDLRTIRKEQVKEKAAKASPKITLITTFLVAPSVILLIAGLMILNMFFGENSILDML
ncbi:type II secretion system F family protein [Paenalkalicoccus suaedae]|uniref:Type II secretion system F family protein n=1 Tax=Paenalkalicoccus suaedae TaxID=2592382 RepID=A0A859FIH2_9BACI|nr:type II secretion system F family protein [Paenalkalicoccus suaedae]QKS72482.1 type II secretion system F family protein [Paenalkalicoccus suaedae]